MEFPKLKGRIVEVYGDQKQFANQLGMSYSSFLNKMSGKTEWTRSEMDTMLGLLKINREQIFDYFFAQ